MSEMLLSTTENGAVDGTREFGGRFEG